MTLGTPRVTVPGNAGLLKTKTYNFLAQDEAQVARILGQPSVSGYVTTDADETGAIIDLTDEGFEFQADHIYPILLKGRHSNDANRWVQTWLQYVRGGTTPVLLGTPQLIHAAGHIGATVVHYGKIAAQATYSQDTATAVAANSTAGSSLGNNSTNTVTLTHPIARDTPKRFWVNVTPDVATNTEQLHGSIIAATSTTASIFLSALVDGAADGFDDAGTITAYGFIVPPPSVDLVMDSNNVQVHVGYDAVDLIQHYVDVFIGEPEYIPFGA